MRNYELTIVLGNKATVAKKKVAVEKIVKLVETFGGKLRKMEDWGENIKGGVSLHFPLELEPGGAKSISAKLKAEELLRYLLVRKGK